MTGEFFFKAPFLAMPKIAGVSEVENPLIGIADLLKEGGEPDLADWADALISPAPESDVLKAIFVNSPFLTELAKTDPQYFRRLVIDGPDGVFQQIISRIMDDLAYERDEQSLMLKLRKERKKAALAIALGDLTGRWSLERVTHALSDFADVAVSAALTHLLLAAAEKGDIELSDPQFPEDGCGYTILAMGKHGARELNYSSDIDLIALFEPSKVDYRGRQSVQQMFVRMTQSLGRIIDQRLAGDRVFRVDWRLRPDPSATPLALSSASARTYYRERGETWERAAMIKARPAAGDLALGRAILTELDAFVFRPEMNFWTLREIGRLKERINEHRGRKQIKFYRYNIKLGRGGIREIEFYAQTQQLIYGGGDPYLRCQRTVDALTTLSEAGYVDEGVADELTDAYEFLRQLEHRLQMINDEQTQTLPADPEEMAQLAAFLGFEDVDLFEEALTYHLNRVERHFNELFDQDKSGGDAVTIELEGDTPSPETLALLEDTGFSNTATAHAILRRWKLGEVASAHDEKGAQALRELLPLLVDATRNSSDPDATLHALDEFFDSIRDGVTVFSLLLAKPALMKLLITAAKCAPAFLSALAQNPTHLQLPLERSFFTQRPDRRVILAECASAFRRADADGQDSVSNWLNESSFQIAAGTITHAMTALDAGRALADIAEALVINAAAATPVFADTAAEEPKPRPPVYAVGRFGGGELVVGERPEMVVLSTEEVDEETAHDWAGRVTLLAASPDVANDDGATADTPSSYLENLVPLTWDRLVDRCRDDASGRALSTMATGRIVMRGDRANPGDDAQFIERLIQDAGLAQLLAEALSGRTELLEATGIDADHAVCHPRESLGALDDIDLLVRAHQFRSGGANPEILSQSVAGALECFEAAGLMTRDQVGKIIRLRYQLRQIESFLAAVVGETSIEQPLPTDLKDALVIAAGLSDFADLVSALKLGMGEVHVAMLELLDLAT